jgi:hypothetical protein
MTPVNTLKTHFATVPRRVTFLSGKVPRFAGPPTVFPEDFRVRAMLESFADSCPKSVSD